MLNGTLRLVGAPKRAGWDDRIERLARALEESDAVVIGAGAGLSTSAGLTYTGERSQRWFGDFIDRYGLTDMYSGGFHPFDGFEEHWAYWSRSIYCNRYVKAPGSAYDDLLALVRDWTASCSPPTWTTSSSSRASTPVACSTRRGTTACSNAAFPAMIAPTTTRGRCARCSRPRGTSRTVREASIFPRASARAGRSHRTWCPAARSAVSPWS